MVDLIVSAVLIFARLNIYQKALGLLDLVSLEEFRIQDLVYRYELLDVDPRNLILSLGFLLLL